MCGAERAALVLVGALGLAGAGPARAAGDGGPVLELEGLAPEAASPGSLADRTTIAGYGQHELMAGEDEVVQFRAHRFVLFVRSQIARRISTATEIEWEFAGSPMKKDGELGTGEVLLEYAVADFELTPWLVLRAGVILMPVSAFNLHHDAPSRELVDRPIAYTTVVPTTWFESGAGFHGRVPLGASQRLSYELYAVNGLDARIYDGFGLRPARGSHFEDNNADKGLTGRLVYSPTLGLEVGLSGYTGAYDLSGRRVNLGNLDLRWKIGDLDLLGEAVRVFVDPGFVEGFSPSSAANTRDAVPEGMWGFFGQANLPFTIPPLWALFPADLKRSTLTAVVRYEGKDTDVDRISAAGDRRRLTLGLNFRPVRAFVIKTDHQLETAGVDGGKEPAEVASGAFWSGGRRARYRFMSSVAYLF